MTIGESHMLIDIVSHCYAAELPHYAAALSYQLSSLILHKPKTCDVQATVCYVWNDARTKEALRFFAQSVNIRSIPMNHLEELGRRAIGRNMAAKWTEADIVWFGDVDQCYQEGCLDRLAALEWPGNAAMIFPRNIMIHRDWTTGDEDMGKLLSGPAVAGIDESRFVPKSYNRAIGGVQIVQGDFAREHGYAVSEKHMQPAVKPFGDFRDDLDYRGFCHKMGGVVGMELPGMFRIRHTRTTYQPDKV